MLITRGVQVQVLSDPPSLKCDDNKMHTGVSHCAGGRAGTALTLQSTSKHLYNQLLTFPLIGG